MPEILLTPLQRKAHRAAAHHLKPVVHIGADGLSPAVVAEADRALVAHGLIKIKVLSDERGVREAMLEALAGQLGAARVQHIGKLLVLWRPRPPQEEAACTPRRAGPRIVKLVSFSKSGSHRATVKKVRVMGNERVTAGGQIKRARVRTSSIKKKPDQA